MSLRPSRRGILAGTGLAGLVATTPTLAATTGKSLYVLGLMCENVENPLGVQLPNVRLSWRLETAVRGTMQTAYRVQVASSLAKLKAGDFDLWDSGKVDSDQAFDVTYQGKALKSRQRACWQVRVWDNHSQSALSPAAFWEMGLLSPADWTGQWLAAEDAEMRGDREAGLYWFGVKRPGEGQTRRVRLSFTLDGDAEVTVMTIANVGYKLFIDGQAITLPPYSPVAFGKQGTVETYVSLKAGKHALAVALDDVTGWDVTPESLIKSALLVRAKLKDGRVVRVNDKTALTSTDNPDTWTSPAFDDSGWSAVTLIPGKTMPLPGKGAFLLRRDFSAKAPVTQARLYVTSLGAYETYINGQRVGDDLLAPESTDFRKRVLYRVHDVTALVKNGQNAIGAMVGDGFYGSYLAPAGRYPFGDAPLRYIAQLDLTYADGHTETIATDDQWSISAAPVTMSDIYDGEDYDARLEQPGWARAGFKGDSRWSPVTLAPPAAGKLEGMISPPIRRTRTLKPVATKLLNGAYVIDFGQNFAGWVRLRTKGNAGDTVTLKFAEVLKADGTIDQSNLRAARAVDIYILKGDPAGEIFEPHFTYHGFRYVEVSGLSSAPKSGDITGIVIHSDLQETGHLRIGNPIIQQLWQNTLWSQRSNFVGIPTDCPQRDERLGWMGDANVFWDAAAFNMNVASFTERWLGDVRDAQSADGAYSNVSPDTIGPDFGTGAAPGWADAGVILAWTTWKRFGDTAVIDQHWQSMTRYIDFITANSDDFIWTENRGADFGDWLSFDSKEPGDDTTPKDLIATAMWKHSVDALIDMARATGRDAGTYVTLSANIRAAFTKAFVQPDGTVSNESQTGYILALHYDLLPEALRAPAAAKLKANIEKRGHLTTGFLGTPFSLDALADAGYSETVYDLLLRTAYPSWGYMVAKGATTIWERWNGDTGDVSMNSFNHYSLGAVTGFVFRRIAGIDPVEAGFKTFKVDPVIDPRVKTGGGEYNAMAGRLATDWSQGPKGSFALSVTVAANTRAKVYLPTPSAAKVREGGKPIAGHPDIRFVGAEGNRTAVEIGSGTYHFAITA
ncbi:alpha-L-rhamnosidase [Asticcacaulis benevestitus]|uniref:alpha-L-rhamnosidase n=1 Tax=Asticcacaulis benevestitus DSM 16100 = ATCC BAA-896 TaxID=1121022 RepID=V4PD15_9CAUL|nr:alpha-L-rhamnosidase [Asticcacaulis benevestitus]ESQ83180.1 hypothetical protein ABENE_20375 [Asticcacaulis benevestitus DSM 16100 = ATCC BAA-896]